MRAFSKKAGSSGKGVDLPANPAETLTIWRTLMIPGAVLFLIALALYWPSLRGGYIWDDQVMASNSLVRGGWAGLRDIWFSAKYGDYVPLTATSFWIEWQIGAGSIEARHLTGIILHASNAVLVWLALRRLRIPAAWAGAAIFAAHPMCVTSVSWIAERKNTLSMLFYLASILLYLRRDGGLRSLSLSLILFIMALLSKSSTVVLPAVLLLLVWWQNGRITRLDVRGTLPFFGCALAAGVAVLTAHYYFGPKLGIVMAGESFPARALGASRAVWFYLEKTFLPQNLTMIYPRWEIDPGSIVWHLPVMGIISAFALIWRFRGTWGKPVLFGLGYYLLALGPVIGVINMAYLRFSQVADHFQYLALPGLAALTAGGVEWMARHVSRVGMAVSRVVFCLLLIILATLTWQHQRLIGNAEALWRDNLKKYPGSWAAHYNLGNELAAQGRFEQAEESYRAALAVNSGFYEAHFGLGNALMGRKMYSEAIESWRQAIKLYPDNTMARNNMAGALQQLGRHDEALLCLREAVKINPNNAKARLNLALMLARKGSFQEAIDNFKGATDADRDSLAAHQNLGLLLSAQGRMDDARMYLLDAMRLDYAGTLEFVRLAARKAGPKSAPLLDATAQAMAKLGKFADAIQVMEEAIGMAESSKQTQTATEYRKRQESYRLGKQR